LSACEVTLFHDRETSRLSAGNRVEPGPVVLRQKTNPLANNNAGTAPGNQPIRLSRGLFSALRQHAEVTVHGRAGRTRLPGPGEGLPDLN
jgi:hypothetical protein